MKVQLGIDVACIAEHQASLADAAGGFVWSGWRFRTTPGDLEALWARLPAGAEVQVVLEPTRNAWVPLAAWLSARGAQVVLVAPEQSADLRDYYNKHTKTDRLDSRVLARLPLLHPEGLKSYAGPTPADPLRRAVRRRSKLVKTRTQVHQRIAALVELLGPTWAEVLGTGDYTKTALVILERYGDPRALKRLGQRRLGELITRTSRSRWSPEKAAELLVAAEETLQLWAGGGLDFAELATDIAAEVRIAQALGEQIDILDKRIAPLFAAADRSVEDEVTSGGVVASIPTLGRVLGAGILGRFGDFDRFDNLPAVRAFTGLVPKIDQSGNSSGHRGITKQGDPGLREALYLAADQIRRVDPTFAARYQRLIIDEHKHHDSALCHLAAILATRIAACWRRHEHYMLRDTDGRTITETEGRAIVAGRYKIDPATRARRRRVTRAKHLKQRTGGRKKESTTAAPAPRPSTTEPNQKTA